MPAYHFKRRSFLAGIGGAFGLATLLRNLEAKAQGIGPPPRFLMMHWPLGTIRTQFIPTGTGTSYVTSQLGQGPGYIIAPFDTPELRSETIILHGFNMSGLSAPGGGGHEAGSVFATTGARSPGTRLNGGRAEDSCAGGPSWDQIFLRNVPALKTPGRGCVNALCDARVDSFETSTQCLSYSHERRSVLSAVPGGMITENTPQLPELSPFNLYTALFAGFVPGGAQSAAAAAERLAQGGSVLDGSTAEMAQLSALAPASERVTIDATGEVIRKLENQLAAVVQSCVPPTPPSTALRAKTGSRNDYGNPVSSSADDTVLEAIGRSHAQVILAAFACDIIRVATFQWAPGTNHVAFRGLDPNNPNVNYMHNPLSHNVLSSAFYNGPRPSPNTYVWDAMVNANRWYFQKTADIVRQFQLQVDPLDAKGQSLLRRTIIPMVTEVAEPAHSRNGHAAIIFGGKGLGMLGGQYQSVSGPHNRLWVTIAQAYLGFDWETALAAETYVKTGATPIPGLWRNKAAA